MLQDLRYSARLLARRPGFTAVALLSLALGLGGASITFGLVDGLVLKPFAYPDPERLVTIGVNFPKMGDSGDGRFIQALSPAEFVDIRGLKTLTRAQAFDLGNRHVSGGDQPERLFTALALGDLFEPIGLRPALGRGFTAEELAPGGPRVAVISHRVWRSRFGADPKIIGRDIRVNGLSTTIVGVMPPELLIIGTDMWLPLQTTPTAWPRGATAWPSGRRPVGKELFVPVRQMPRFWNQLFLIVRTDGEPRAMLPAIRSAIASIDRDQPAYAIQTLSEAFAASLFAQRTLMVLLLLFAGLATTLAAIGIYAVMSYAVTMRTQEIGIRMALGAGAHTVRTMVVRQVLWLVGSGVTLGLAGALALGRLASSVLAGTSAADPITLGAVVLLLGGVALLAGYLPARRASRIDPIVALRAS